MGYTNYFPYLPLILAATVKRINANIVIATFSTGRDRRSGGDSASDQESGGKSRGAREPPVSHLRCKTYFATNPRVFTLRVATKREIVTERKKSITKYRDKTIFYTAFHCSYESVRNINDSTKRDE